MNQVIQAAMLGLIGGLARAFFGLIKHYRFNNKTSFKPVYLLITIIGAGVVGSFTALLVSTNYFIPLIAGYAGIDLIESLIKAYSKKISWY